MPIKVKKKPKSTAISTHIKRLERCRKCPKMIPPVVFGQAVPSKVLLVGQAPGDREGEMGKPFAWTAGKTLFKWFQQIGLSEEEFRERVYMAAVCRCFPGKNPKGGDRVPNAKEIENCATWLNAEFDLLKPELVIPVGKLAIAQFVDFNKLTEVVGKKISIEYGKHGAKKHSAELIPLPHPSGASTWHRMEPGKTLLKQALGRIKRHPAFEELR